MPIRQRKLVNLVCTNTTSPQLKLISLQNENVRPSTSNSHSPWFTVMSRHALIIFIPSSPQLLLTVNPLQNWYPWPFNHSCNCNVRYWPKSNVSNLKAPLYLVLLDHWQINGLFWLFKKHPTEYIITQNKILKKIEMIKVHFLTIKTMGISIKICISIRRTTQRREKHSFSVYSCVNFISFP